MSEGVYAAVAGPAYETPAETEMLRGSAPRSWGCRRCPRRWPRGPWACASSAKLRDERRGRRGLARGGPARLEDGGRRDRPRGGRARRRVLRSTERTRGWDTTSRTTARRVGARQDRLGGRRDARDRADPRTVRQGEAAGRARHRRLPPRDHGDGEPRWRRSRPAAPRWRCAPPTALDPGRRGGLLVEQSGIDVYAIKGEDTDMFFKHINAASISSRTSRWTTAPTW